MSETPRIPTLTIGATSVSLGDVWVHLQDPSRCSAQQFVMFVPENHVAQVFDPHSRRSPDLPLERFIQDDVAELGTFILEGYLKNAQKVTGIQQGPYRWVIAEFDRVETSTDGVAVFGQAIPWAPQAYA